MALCFLHVPSASQANPVIVLVGKPGESVRNSAIIAILDGPVLAGRGVKGKPGEELMCHDYTGCRIGNPVSFKVVHVP